MTLLLIHLAFAFSSLILAMYLYVKPSGAMFNVSYGLIAGTLVSGTVLTVFSHGHVMQSVLSGVIYLAIVSVATVAAHRKAIATE